MILVLDSKVNPYDLETICKEYFGTFIKFVADNRRNMVAIGGELHSDAESLLINSGSLHHDL